MKKLFFTLLLTSLFSFAANAQANYDLDFEFSLSEDTLMIGDIDTLSGFISNNGPAAFSGEIVLNVSVYYSSDTASEINPPDKISYTLLANPILLDLDPLGKVNIKIPFEITDDFWEDSTNIVIVWPSDGYQDDNNNNNYGRFNLFVQKDTSLSINHPKLEISSFSVYPNPAKNNVNISFETVRKGQIVLTDITGKTLLTENISAGSQNILLPLSSAGKQLPQGLYFVTLQTDKQRVVKKLQVIF